jgi:hypothetical protein
MRVTRSTSEEGAIYRLYRSDDAFVQEMRALIPFLHQADCDLAVGGTEGDPHVVLIVGPLTEMLDEAFQRRVKRYLVT